jgi:hypothetical protein
MMKTLCRSLLCLMILPCLSACDPAYTVPVEVNLSEEFLAQWDAGYPAEVAIRYDADQQSQLPLYALGSPLGHLCAHSSGPVRFETTLDELGHLPEGLTVTVWIAPDPKLTQTRCAQPSEGGGSVDTTPEQGVSRTVKVKRLNSGQGERVVLDF